jgi:hypothetical protein
MARIERAEHDFDHVADIVVGVLHHKIDTPAWGLPLLLPNYIELTEAKQRRIFGDPVLQPSLV